jgi:hypothetical protein
MASFVNPLIKSQEQAHIFHLTTDSYAVHKALEGYYTTIPSLIDRFIETYHATHKKLGAFKGSGRLSHDPKKILPYFKSLSLKIKRARLPKTEPWLDNIRIEVLELIMGTIYKLGLDGKQKRRSGIANSVVYIQDSKNINVAKNANKATGTNIDRAKNSVYLTGNPKYNTRNNAAVSKNSRA